MANLLSSVLPCFGINENRLIGNKNILSCGRKRSTALPGKELPSRKAPFITADLVSHAELASKYDTASKGVFVLTHRPLSRRPRPAKQTSPQCVYSNLAAVKGLGTSSLAGTCASFCEVTLSLLESSEPALLADIRAHLQRVTEFDSAGSLTLHLAAQKYPDISAKNISINTSTTSVSDNNAAGLACGRQSFTTSTGRKRCWTHAVVEPACYVAPRADDASTRRPSSRVPNRQSGIRRPGDPQPAVSLPEASGVSAATEVWPAVVVSLELTGSARDNLGSTRRGGSGGNGLLAWSSWLRGEGGDGADDEGGVLDTRCIRGAAEPTVEAEEGSCAAAAAAADGTVRGHEGATSAPSGRQLASRGRGGGGGGCGDSVGMPGPKPTTVLQRSGSSCFIGLQNRSSVVTLRERRLLEGTCGGVLSVGVPAGGLHSTEERARLREGMVLGGLTSIVTALAADSKEVLFQNATSLLYYGARGGPWTRLEVAGLGPGAGAGSGTVRRHVGEKEEVAREEMDVIGCSHGGSEGGSVLADLFRLEPVKLNRLLTEVCTDGRVWKGIIRVPTSCHRSLSKLVRLPGTRASCPPAGLNADNLLLQLLSDDLHAADTAAPHDATATDSAAPRVHSLDGTVGAPVHPATVTPAAAVSAATSTAGHLRDFTPILARRQNSSVAVGSPDGGGDGISGGVSARGAVGGCRGGGGGDFAPSAGESGTAGCCSVDAGGVVDGACSAAAGGLALASLDAGPVLEGLWTSALQVAMSSTVEIVSNLEAPGALQLLSANINADPLATSTWGLLMDTQERVTSSTNNEPKPPIGTLTRTAASGCVTAAAAAAGIRGPPTSAATCAAAKHAKVTPPLASTSAEIQPSVDINPRAYQADSRTCTQPPRSASPRLAPVVPAGALLEDWGIPEVDSGPGSYSGGGGGGGGDGDGGAAGAGSCHDSIQAGRVATAASAPSECATARPRSCGPNGPGTSRLSAVINFAGLPHRQQQQVQEEKPEREREREKEQRPQQPASPPPQLRQSSIDRRLWMGAGAGVAAGDALHWRGSHGGPLRRSVSRADLNGNSPRGNIVRMVTFASTLRNAPSAVQHALQLAVSGSVYGGGGDSVAGGGGAGGGRGGPPEELQPSSSTVVAVTAATVPVAAAAVAAMGPEPPDSPGFPSPRKAAWSAVSSSPKDPLRNPQTGRRPHSPSLALGSPRVAEAGQGTSPASPRAPATCRSVPARGMSGPASVPSRGTGGRAGADCMDATAKQQQQQACLEPCDCEAAAAAVVPPAPTVAVSAATTQEAFLQGSPRTAAQAAAAAAAAAGAGASTGRRSSSDDPGTGQHSSDVASARPHLRSRLLRIVDSALDRRGGGGGGLRSMMMRTATPRSPDASCSHAAAAATAAATAADCKNAQPSPADADLAVLASMDALLLGNGDAMLRTILDEDEDEDEDDCAGSGRAAVTLQRHAGLAFRGGRGGDDQEKQGDGEPGNGGGGYAREGEYPIGGGGGGAGQSYCWHEVCASRTTDPVTGQYAIVLTQVDVTAKVEAERHLALVSEAEHRLLEQIFPRHVLTYMTEEGGPWAARCTSSDISAALPVVRDINKLATSHSQVTLLFADIQGFTPMCKVLEPREVMAFLNDLFTRFDNMLDKFGVYKVETIGDCYFVAGGLIHQDEEGMPAVRARESNADPLHAERVFAFAKAMLSAAAHARLPTTGGPVRMRIGIHSGPVVSGVVGQRMPRFCLFGDTVNTTSRMESTGVPGCIHASEAARNLLRHEAWAPTGGIEVKGKGLMHTYLWVSPDQGYTHRDVLSQFADRATVVQGLQSEDSACSNQGLDRLMAAYRAAPSGPPQAINASAVASGGGA